MSTENNATSAQPMANVNEAARFLHKPGPKYYYKGKVYDLRIIDTQTAEALAKDPDCAFVQWKDPLKRPQGQRNSFDVPDAPKASATDKPKS